MFPILHIGPLAVRTPLLIVVLGFWVASLWAEREAGRLQLDSGHINSLITLPLIGGIVAGRLVYVLRFLDSFQGSWLAAFSLNPATIDPVGGFAAATLIFGGYLYFRRLPWRQSLDALVLPFALLTLALGGSLLASGAFYGEISTVPWAIELWGGPRHPTQIYLMVAAFLILGCVWIGRNRLATPGSLFFFWLFLTGFSLLIIEGFRGNPPLVGPGLRLWQLIYLPAALFSLWVLYYGGRQVFRSK